jgi:hypothetical protein
MCNPGGTHYTVCALCGGEGSVHCVSMAVNVLIRHMMEAFCEAHEN